jgi:hypothetical protein
MGEMFSNSLVHSLLAVYTDLCVAMKSLAILLRIWEVSSSNYVIVLGFHQELQADAGIAR